MTKKDDKTTNGLKAEINGSSWSISIALDPKWMMPLKMYPLERSVLWRRSCYFFREPG